MSRPDSNEVLFDRFRSVGDAEAFRRVFYRTAPELVRQVRRMRIPAADVDDVVQDAFVVACVRADHFDARRDLLNWLRGIVVKRAQAERRRLRRRPPLAVGAADFAAAADAVVIANEEARDLKRALRALPDRYREVIELAYGQGLSPQAIGHRLDRSASTVRTQLARAIERLRKLMPAGFGLAWLGVLGLPALTRGMGICAGSPGVGGGAPMAAPPLAPGRRGPLLVLGSAAALFLAVPWWMGGSRPDAAVPVVIGEHRAPVVDRGTGRAGEQPLPAARTAALAMAIPSARATDLRVVLVGGDEDPVSAGITFGLDFTQSFPPNAHFAHAAFAVGTTDALGVARFADPRLGRARARFGSVVGSQPFEVARGTRVEVPLQAARRLRGTVVDGVGCGVAGAEIWRSERPRGAFYPPMLIAHTSADGSFDVRVPPVDRVTLWARAAGLGRSALQRVNTADRGDDETMTVAIRPGRGVLRGHAWSEGGRAVPRALVSVCPVDPTTLLATEYAWSGADGGFEVGALPPGRYRVAGLGADGGYGRAVVRVRSDGVATVDVALQPGCSVRGRVVDGAGRPVPGLIVVGAPRDAGSEACKLGFRLAQTDRSGAFELSAVPSGPAVLAIVRPENGHCLAVAAQDLADRDGLEWYPVVCPPGGDGRSVPALAVLRQWIMDSPPPPEGVLAKGR